MPPSFAGRPLSAIISIAAHGHTAAEVIDERANADKPFMELTAFSVGRRDFPTEKDIGNAKNCLTEERLFLDDRFGQYSQVIRQPFFSGVPEYGDRVVFPYGKHLPNTICLSGMYDKIKAGIRQFLIAPFQIYKAVGVQLSLRDRTCQKGQEQMAVSSV